MSLDIATLFAAREAERYALHARHLNEQLVRVLKTVGFDVGFCQGDGQYLVDRQGTRYLDLMSGWGVFALGRNHPALRDALMSVLDARLPNLIHMDASPLAGVLAERLLQLVPYLDKAYFANSGTETVETALKFARCATGRAGIVYCSHAYHGLTYGALSINGDETFRTGFAPFMGNCTEVPFDDLDTLDRALATRQVAAFIVEPIQARASMFRATIICRPHSGCVANTAPCSSPTRCRPGSDGPDASSPWNIGESSPTSCCCRRRCRAATCRSARC